MMTPIVTRLTCRAATQRTRLEASIGLQHQRLEAVLAVLHDRGVARVLDLGCGDGALVRRLLRDPRITEIVGMDVSRRHLDRAAARLRLEDFPPPQRQRLKLIQGSLLYRDTRLVGYDAAVLIEVIEHLEPTRLGMFAQVLFGYTRPGMVILTTPNREYNVQWPSLRAGGLRHRDHRFEWTRAEFQQWARRVARAVWIRRGLQRPWAQKIRTSAHQRRWGSSHDATNHSRTAPSSSSSAPPGRGNPPSPSDTSGRPRCCRRMPAGPWSRTPKPTKRPHRRPSRCSTSSPPSAWPLAD